MKPFSRSVLVSVLGVAAAWSSHLVHTETLACRVVTTSGEIQGLNNGASCAFLGVPFAAPPTGNHRWRRPEPASPWAPAVLNAMTLPANCAQLNVTTGLPVGTEDCLKLNIWTPNPMPPGGAPVIVWLHPGGFVNASANFAPQNGMNLAATTGTIVVAPNYRLGPFGFLGHEALEGEDSAAGNFGLLDQRAALAWVRDRISSFGGDPDNVTVAGQSAGAHSVGLHLVAPGSTGLFHRAIMESGFASFRWRTADEARRQGDDFASALGCANPDPSQVLACLRTKTPVQILLARPPALFEQITESGRTQWTPVVDGIEIPDQPRRLYERGAFNRVPVLLGVNRDEGWTFVQRSFPGALTTEQYLATLTNEFGSDASSVLNVYDAAAFPSPTDALSRVVGDVEYVCEARRTARAIERTRTPVFLYSFERELLPVALDHVVHGLEVNFVFGNSFGPPLFPNYALNADDVVLSRAMAGYWSRFAATGNPNVDVAGVVHWPAFRRPEGPGRGVDKYLVLDSPIRAGLRLRETQCDFWEPYFLRSVTGAVPASAP